MPINSRAKKIIEMFRAVWITWELKEKFSVQGASIHCAMCAAQTGIRVVKALNILGEAVILEKKLVF